MRHPQIITPRQIVTPGRLDFTDSEIQTLNALIKAALNGVEAELTTPVHGPRANFLKEARDTCQKWLRGTGGALPDAPPSIIMPRGP